jgi:hypothetical protein
LLQLAKIANHETRMNKFEEFKKGIDKKINKNERENDTDELHQSDDKNNNNEELHSVQNGTDNEIINKKILRFQTHVNTFKTKLGKFKKSSVDSASVEMLKPELIQILSLINEILN